LFSIVKVNNPKRKKEREGKKMLSRFLLLQNPSNVARRLLSSETRNPIVFLDIKIAEKEVGRMTFELFSDKVPKTSENFRSLCVGDNEAGLRLQGSSFHRVIPYFVAQGGDITKNDGLTPTEAQNS